MAEQEFHGEVGQVAGRDIINEASQMLWDCETPDLKREFRRCKAKLWQVRRDIFLNVPFFWSVAGMLGSAWLLLSGTLFKIAGQVWFFAWMFGAMIIPMLWLGAVLPLRQMGQAWSQLFPAERQRIVKLLIERLTLREEGIEITWRDTGWHALAGEMRPGTIGGELLEMEQQESGMEVRA